MPSLHLPGANSWLLSSPPVEWAMRQLRELLIGALRQGPIPQHVAFVMDGNRRFARSHQIETVEGHNLGFEALARILEVCYKSGVKVVTIYAFSIENFKRSKYEVDALMDMAQVKLAQLIQHGDLLDRYGASIRILGQKELIKPELLKAINDAVKMTSRNGDCVLNVCFPYTSRDEITTAIRDTVSDYSKPRNDGRASVTDTHIQSLKPSKVDGDVSSPDLRLPSPSADDLENSASSSTTLNQDSPNSQYIHDGPDSDYPDPEHITAKVLDEHMYTAGSPPLELLVRTSGVERLSDFMLWQCHEETEVVFLECLWPEFDLWHFLPVLVEWQWRRKKADEKALVATGLRGSQKVKVR